MYPIFMHENTGGEGLDFDSFSERMINICNEHRGADRALAFAFILCDFGNPQIWKILSDEEYWRALNEISGEYLTVFSLNYNPTKNRARNIEYRDLARISTNYNPRVATNTLIQKYFGEIKVNYPAILFFQVNNDSVIDSLLIDLKEQEIEKAFLELKNYLTRAVSALERIAPENKQNIGEVFNCLEEEVKFVRKTKGMVQNAVRIKDLLSSIKGIL